ncbi:ATP-dependent DNA helicase [Rufibacter immobilis]|uniref:ATP-dependent DNA helicase n=1 Tax=Rufibacter immobilis TaxID=1348778 RepID=UPI0035EF02EE
MSIFQHFQHLSLSNDQSTALEMIESFLASDTQVFMLKGYAGSGKTTILKGLVEYLGAEKKNFALMAPTGRAAKVIREKTGQEAFTIHKSIYSYDELEEVEIVDEEGGQSFCYYFKVRNNTDVANKIFIIDEASMVSDAKSQGEFFRFGSDQLLTDLFEYTRVTKGNAHSKIIFVGDPCQLPPVGDNSSKAFDKEYLGKKFQVSIESAEMKEVKRQGGDSGILKAASKIRKSLSSGFFNDFNLEANGKDIYNLTYESFLQTYFATSSSKIIVAYKNKTCLTLNQQIRNRRFGSEMLPMQKADIVILGANNYRKGVFNGEFAVVNDVAPNPISRDITFYPSYSKKKATGSKETVTVTLTWRFVELVFPDAESSNKNVSGYILENFLYGDNYLTPEETQALYVDFKKRHPKLKPKTDEFKETIINDDFFNCLKIKYGYAVTCHKAQGGEWENVFTVWDHDNRINFNCYKDPQIRTAKDNEGFYRWAYTAMTRASQNLFAINPPKFNSYSTMAIMAMPVVAALNELTNNQFQTQEISIDDSLLAKLQQLGLLEQPIQIQDHFINVQNALQRHFIEVVGWQRKNLEIFYLCQREDKSAGLKTWVNQSLVFNGKYMKLPAHTNDDTLYAEAESTLKKMSPCTVKRNTTDTILAHLEFEFELEEKYPFTRTLFDDLQSLLLGTNIKIDTIEHQQYKERYTFLRQSEKVTLDFEYNSAGFFGRVVPIQNKTNSSNLLSEIVQGLRALKEEEHANQRN